MKKKRRKTTTTTKTEGGGRGGGDYREEQKKKEKSSDWKAEETTGLIKNAFWVQPLCMHIVPNLLCALGLAYAVRNACSVHFSAGTKFSRKIELLVMSICLSPLTLHSSHLTTIRTWCTYLLRSRVMYFCHSSGEHSFSYISPSVWNSLLLPTHPSTYSAVLPPPLPPSPPRTHTQGSMDTA